MILRKLMQVFANQKDEGLLLEFATAINGIIEYVSFKTVYSANLITKRFQDVKMLEKMMDVKELQLIEYIDRINEISHITFGTYIYDGSNPPVFASELFKEMYERNI